MGLCVGLLGLSELESAFVRLCENNVLVGILTSHVGDVSVAGIGKPFGAALEELSVRIQLKFKYLSFRFCGKMVSQSEGYTVAVDQMDAIDYLAYVIIERQMCTRPDLPLLPGEVTSLRSLLGSMGWTVRQTRFARAAIVSFAAPKTNNQAIKDMPGTSRMVKLLKDEREVTITFRPLPGLKFDAVNSS